MGENSSSSEIVIATVHLYVAHILELDILYVKLPLWVIKYSSFLIGSSVVLCPLITVHNTQHQSSSTSCWSSWPEETILAFITMGYCLELNKLLHFRGLRQLESVERTWSSPRVEPFRNVVSSSLSSFSGTLGRVITWFCASTCWTECNRVVSCTLLKFKFKTNPLVRLQVVENLKSWQLSQNYNEFYLLS